MAGTKIADVIVPEVFTDYVILETSKKSAILQSGIMQTVEKLALGVGEGNRLINMPYWNGLTGSDQVLSDNGSLVTKKITSGKDVATQLFRGDAWGTNELSATMSGDDPAGATASLVAKYWVDRMQDVLVSIIKGCFIGAGATLAATHLNTIALETTVGQTASNLISGAAIVDTVSKLGDAHEVLTGMIMHSVPYFNLVKQQLIVYEKNADGTVTYPTFMGKRVILDDGMPVIAGSTSGNKYLTVLFGQGAIGYAEGQPETPTETDRDSLAGEDILINRKHFVMHPRGVKFTNTTCAGLSPTNTELSTTNNWSKIYEDKQIRMVGLLTNG